MSGLFDNPAYKTEEWYAWPSDLQLNIEDLHILLDCISTIVEISRDYKYKLSNKYEIYKYWAKEIKTEYKRDKNGKNIPETDIDAILDYLWNACHENEEYQGNYNFYKFLEALDLCREKLIETIYEFPMFNWDKIIACANPTLLVECFVKKCFTSIEVDDISKICDVLSGREWFGMIPLDDELYEKRTSLRFIYDDWKRIMKGEVKEEEELLPDSPIMPSSQRITDNTYLLDSLNELKIRDRLASLIDSSFGQLGWDINFCDALEPIEEILLDDVDSELWNLARYRTGDTDYIYSCLEYIHLRMPSIKKS